MAQRTWNASSSANPLVMGSTVPHTAWPPKVRRRSAARSRTALGDATPAFAGVWGSGSDRVSPSATSQQYIEAVAHNLPSQTQLRRTCPIALTEIREVERHVRRSWACDDPIERRLVLWGIQLSLQVSDDPIWRSLVLWDIQLSLQVCDDPFWCRQVVRPCCIERLSGASPIERQLRGCGGGAAKSSSKQRREAA